MNDYLNAKSMVKPGVAGGLVMLISNTLASQFAFQPKWTGLVLSAVLGLLVVWGFAAPFLQKVILWAFNSLIIFSMAVGTNQAGASLNKEPTLALTTTAVPGPSASPLIEVAPLPEFSPAIETSPTPKPHSSLAPVMVREMKDKAFFQSWLGENG